MVIRCGSDTGTVRFSRSPLRTSPGAAVRPVTAVTAVTASGRT
ncbi:hypothetical protein [Streptomyces sp. NBC_01207]|nr:hypothetical protein OG457_44155 [Streptomyces sp. NBC_01207]